MESSCVMKCDDNQDRVNGACVPECDLVEFRDDNGDCVSSCPEGQEGPVNEPGFFNTDPDGNRIVLGICVPVCGADEVRIFDDCVPMCEANEMRMRIDEPMKDPRSECVCIAGYDKVDGACIRTNASCHRVADLNTPIAMRQGIADGNDCRQAMNNEECQIVSPMLPMYNEQTSACEVADSNADCKLVFPDRPIYDEDTSACRMATDSDECRRIFPGTVEVDGGCITDDDRCAAQDATRPKYVPATGECRARTQDECGIQYADPATDGNCRDPRNDTECRETLGTTPIFDDSTPGTFCRAATTTAECFGAFSEGAPIFEVESCRLPRNAAECLLVAGMLTPIGNAVIFDEEEGICREPESHSECADQGAATPFFDRTVAGNCREIASNRDCFLLNPLRPLLHLQSNACRAFADVQEAGSINCGDFRNPDPYEFPQCENSEYRVVSTSLDSCGTCQAESQCAAFAGGMAYEEDGINICGSAEMCTARGKYLDETTSPAECRAAQNAAECAATFEERPAYDSSAPDNCRAARRGFECEAGMSRIVYDEAAPGNCRAATSHGDCAVANSEMPFYDTAAPGNCRVPLSHAECIDIGLSRPYLSASGSCMALSEVEEAGDLACGDFPGIDPHELPQCAGEEYRVVIEDSSMCGSCQTANECLNDAGGFTYDDGGRLFCTNESACDARGLVFGTDSCSRPADASDCEGEQVYDDEERRCLDECVDPRIRDDESNSCRYKTQDDCAAANGMILDEASRDCRVPLDGLECRTAGIGAVLENGSCAETCEDGRVAAAERLLVCGLPASGAECRNSPGATGTEVLEGGSCAEACLNGREPDEEFNCRNPLQEECGQTGMIADGNTCRAPRDAAECMAASSEFNYKAGDACVTACPTGSIPGEDGECRDLLQADCSPDDRILAEGVCRDPINGFECAVATGGRLSFYVGIQGGCAERCPENTEAGYQNTCRGLGAEDCIALSQILDVNSQSCRNPLNASECAQGNPRMPAYDSETGLCRARTQEECAPQFSDPTFIGNCRAAQSSAECRATNPAQPVYDEGTSACRSAANNQECALADSNRPLYDPDAPGNCRAPRHGDCFPLLSDPDAPGGCRLPVNGAECRTANPVQPIFDAGSCRRPENHGECMALEASLPVYDRQTESCQAVLSDEDCRKIHQAALAVFDANLPGRCRVIASPAAAVAHCANSEEILVGGNCVSPADDTGCAILDASKPTYDEDSGLCRETRPTDCTDGERFENGLCVGILIAPAATEDDSDILPMVFPAIAVASYALYSTSPLFRPHLSASSDGEWESSGRIEFSDGAFKSYIAASYENGDDGPVYETGGAYRSGVWSASYRTREAREMRAYEFSIGGAWRQGAWNIRPNAGTALEYDAEDNDWISSGSLGVGAAWTASKWRISQNTGLGWGTGQDSGSPRIRLDVERNF